ncbi:MAG: adenylyl-sulfate kinase [Patescibacteria group bacterium]
MKGNEIDSVLQDASRIARRAGAGILNVRKSVFKTNAKADGSMVTDADLCAEKIIQEGLASFGWPILSEEGVDDTLRLKSEFVWIVDPLDGTRSFAEGKDDFVVMIGLVKNGTPILGVVYQPAEDKLYEAIKGKGAFLTVKGTRTKLSTSDIKESHEARYISSLHHGTEASDILPRILQITRRERVASNGVKMGLIAEGRFDILFNPTYKMGEWDTCAPQVIIEEAGGIVTGAFGQELVYNKEVPLVPYGILATNGALHGKVLTAISKINDTEKQGVVLWFTGLSGSGKSTLAEALKKNLEKKGKRVVILDGDVVRKEHKEPLGFSREHIRENNFRIAYKAFEESKNHDVILVAAISPYREDRKASRILVGKNYHEVFIDCPLEVCEARDVKGLYREARKGKIPHMIGASERNPYEKPTHPDIVIDTSSGSIEEEVEKLEKHLGL